MINMSTTTSTDEECDRRLIRKLGHLEIIIKQLLTMQTPTVLLEKKLSQFDEAIYDLANDSLVAHEWIKKSASLWKQFALELATSTGNGHNASPSFQNVVQTREPNDNLLVNGSNSAKYLNCILPLNNTF